MSCTETISLQNLQDIMISVQKWDTILEIIYVNWHKRFIIGDLKQAKYKSAVYVFPIIT